MQILRMPDVIDRPRPVAMFPATGNRPGAAPVPNPAESCRPHGINAKVAASIVHDLRSPLAAICACSEMLRSAEMPPEQTRRLAANIHRSAGRVRELVSELACLVRGAGADMEVCDLGEILAAASKAACIAEREEFQLLIDVPGPIELRVVRGRVERVFVNLIVNAMEAIPGGGTIRITAREMSNHALIEVEDTGPGVPLEIRGRLFEPFVTAGKKDGLGLGLALSREIVRDHGGELWLEAAPGARFMLSLPLSLSSRA